MFIICWSAKGGSGTTVVAATLGVLLARHSVGRPCTLVDLGGDQPAALGVAEPPGPGIAEWMAAPNAPDDALLRLATPADGSLQVVHRGAASRPGASAPLADDTGWERLVRACACAAEGSHVILDAGSGIPPPVAHAAADHSLLVTRACYLSLRRASACASAATGVILVTEPGRSLGVSDIEHALGARVRSEVPWDPAVARAVDAGLLVARLPQSIARPLRRFTLGEVIG